MRRICNSEKPVRVWHGAPSGKSSAWLSTRSIIERPLVRPQFPGPDILRASEPVSCWPHKPREWRSTRQPATRFLGESFNGRTAGLQPANEGSIPSSSTKFAREAAAVQAPAEKPDKHVRLVLLEPS